MMFYLSVDCGHCDEEILYGPCITTVAHDDGAPVIPYDMAAQNTFRCGNCNAVNFTGDFELLCERG